MENKIENAQVTILLEIEGKVYLVGMKKERLETINFLIKSSTELLIKTNVSQKDLIEFLEYSN